MNFWCKNEQAACGTILQTVVFAVKTLQVVYLTHNSCSRISFFGFVVINLNQGVVWVEF